LHGDALKKGGGAKAAAAFIEGKIESWQL